MLSTIHVITFLPLFVSFVCRFSIFLRSLFHAMTMPALSRLQRKRSQGEAMTGATSKRLQRNRQPSQPTIFPSVRSAVSSVDLSTSSPSFNNDLISRLADAVTQRLRQENQPFWLHYSLPILLSWRYQLQSLPLHVSRVIPFLFWKVPCKRLNWPPSQQSHQVSHQISLSHPVFHSTRVFLKRSAQRFGIKNTLALFS